MNSDESFMMGTLLFLMATVGLMLIGDAWVTKNAWEMVCAMAITLPSIFLVGLVIGLEEEDE